MKLPTRFRVRTLMAIVALVAIGFSVAFELKNHAERDRLLRRRADGYRLAAIHRMRTLECKLAWDRQDPYSSVERAKLLAGDRVGMPIPPGGFRSWEGEMLNHQHWGDRFFDVADSLERNLEAVEARLLLPVPTGR
jgi:hypothetical protein